MAVYIIRLMMCILILLSKQYIKEILLLKIILRITHIIKFQQKHTFYITHEVPQSYTFNISAVGSCSRYPMIEDAIHFSSQDILSQDL
jgi:hypothetical protein